MLDLSQFEQNYQPYNLGQATSQKQKGKPSFLQSLFPTIGGIGGGALGGAAGGALAGSAILPGIGTAAGGLIGALLGGATGGAAGKVAENAATGQGLASGVGGQALEQGVLSAGPLRLLKGAKAAVGAVKGGEGLVGALNGAGQAATAPGALKTLVANKLNDTADNLAQRGLKMNGSAFNTAFKNRSGEEVGQFANRFNIPQSGLQATATKVLQPGFDAHAAAVQSVGDIPKEAVLASIKDQIAKEVSSKVPDSNAFANKVTKKAQGILDNFGDTISAPELNAVKTELAGQVNHAATDTASRSANEVLNRVSSGLRNAINQAADNKGIAVDPALAKLGYKAKSVGDLGEEVHNLTDFLKQADVKSRVGNGSAPFSLSALPGAAVGSGAGAPAGIALGATTQLANSGLGRRAISSTASKLADKATASATGATNPVGLGAIAKRSAPLGLAGALQNQATGYLGGANSDTTNTPNGMDTITNSNANIDTQSQDSPQLSSDLSTGQDGGQGSQSLFNPNNIEANVQQILQNGGKLSDAAQYIAMAKQVNDIQNAGQGKAKQLTSQQQKDATNAQSGLAALAKIQQTLQQNPRAAGESALPGGSLTARLTGTGDYRAAVNNASDVIGRLRSGGAIQDDEARRYLAMLPSAFDDPQTANYKLQTLGTIFSQIANPEPAQADNSDLLAALGVQQ